MYYAAPYLITLGRVLLAVDVHSGRHRQDLRLCRRARIYGSARRASACSCRSSILTESGGGLCVLLGLFTRYAAIALAGFCVLAAIFFPLAARRPDADDQLHEEHHHRRRLSRARGRRPRRVRARQPEAERVASIRRRRLAGWVLAATADAQALVLQQPADDQLHDRIAKGRVLEIQLLGLALGQLVDHAIGRAHDHRRGAPVIGSKHSNLADHRARTERLADLDDLDLPSIT